MRNNKRFYKLKNHKLIFLIIKIINYLYGANIFILLNRIIHAYQMLASDILFIYLIHGVLFEYSLKKDICLTIFLFGLF